jgi:23S rRNA pseudouridine2605 synthase
VLANAGVASRRNIEQMIRDGRIAINGKIVATLPILVDPIDDKIEVDGETVKIAGDRGGPRLYILLNKPKHVYSTNVAQGEQTCAVDLLPPNLPGRVYPVGRLDADSKGLLLLTNDGELTNRLTHPRYGVAKTYRAAVDGFVEGRTLQALTRGSIPHAHGGAKTGRNQVKIVNRSRVATILEIIIRDGRDHQIRRMLARMGHTVRDLTRVRLGPLTLHGLGVGQFRSLTTREIRQLRGLGNERKPGIHVTT